MADLDTLTPRQREIYEFIRGKIQGRGYGPTVREIGQEFDIKSPNGVMCHLKALQKKGLIHREPNMSRAIQLLEDPVSVPRTGAGHGVKLLGRIAAGAPIEAIELSDEVVDFQDWEFAEDKFALRVSGDSMIEEHIADGDFVIIRRQETARDGQIVAVRDEDGEATLKFLFRDKGRIRLEPANSSMKPIFRNKVDILGVLVGVVRRYNWDAQGTGQPFPCPGSHRSEGRCLSQREPDVGEDRWIMDADSPPPQLVQLFTDGACSGNPGPGGWAFILRHPASGKVLDASGAEPHTTNNRMELMGVVKGLESLKRPCRVELVTDSQYVAKGIAEWMPRWKQQGWRRKEGQQFKPVVNEDLWRQIDSLVSLHQVRVKHVLGHNGHPENEAADRMAVAAYKQLVSDMRD